MLRLARIHGRAPESALWGLEHVSVLQALGCGVHLLQESGVLGGPWLAVVEGNPPVCQLRANMEDKHQLQLRRETTTTAKDLKRSLKL